MRGNNPIPDNRGHAPGRFAAADPLPTPFNSGQGNACPEAGTFVGVPSPSPYATQPNVFSGRQNSASSVVFLGVPIDAPGTAGHARDSYYQHPRQCVPARCFFDAGSDPITMFIAVNGSQQVTINNPTQTVAFIQIGLIVGSGTANLAAVQRQQHCSDWRRFRTRS